MDKMFQISNYSIQAVQIKPQLNILDNWVEWNRKLKDILVIVNI